VQMHIKKGAVKIKLSILSRIPPCPGIREDESFMPDTRFAEDSNRSPAWPRMPIVIPMMRY
jgi:hypothetical protein